MDDLKGVSRYKISNAFVNSLSIDQTLHQFLLCGSADSSISVFDLNSSNPKPAADVAAKSVHKFGVSTVKWWHDDNGMFVSGSFDNSVNLWDTDSLEAVYTFQLDSKIYNVDLNKLGVVAAALDHPYIRLLDARSGSHSQVLKGHKAKVLSVKWCPVNEHLLASGGSDGTVRLWDVRQGQSQVSCFDMNFTSPNRQLEALEYRKSHRGPVNGLCWVGSGDRLVSLGQDNKARVWNLNVAGGLNEGLNYGPLIQNRFLQNNDPLVTSLEYGEPRLLVNTDSGAVLMYDLDSGKLIKRMEPPSRASSMRQACIVERGYPRAELYTGDGEGNVTEWSKQQSFTRDEDLQKGLDKGLEETKQQTLGDYL